MWSLRETTILKVKSKFDLIANFRFQSILFNVIMQISVNIV